MKTPHQVLKALGACPEWLRRVRGKSWSEAWELARSKPLADGGWSWLYYNVQRPGDPDPECFPDCGCNDTTPTEMLGALPVDAWLVALRSAGQL